MKLSIQTLLAVCDDAHAQEPVMMQLMGTDSGPAAPVDAWLSAARGGDNEAFGQAMEACRQYLMLVADREMDGALRAKGGASDIVQETFLDAQKDFDRFAGRSEPELKCWLHRILRNNLVSFARRFRQSKREMRREVPMGREGGAAEADGVLVARTESPSGHAIRREQVHDLSRVMERLPERQRAIIEWRHQEQCAFEEIGRRLGVSADAARMCWARAVRRLQEELGARPPVGEVGGPPHDY